MEPPEIRARIAEIRTELDEKVAELDELIAKLNDDDRDAGGRPRLWIIKGGLGALALPVAPLARRPRPLRGIGVGAAVAAAVAVVLLVPAHTTPGGVGGDPSSLYIPAVAPPRPGPPAARTPAPHGRSATPSASARAFSAQPVAAVSALPGPAFAPPTAPMPTPPTAPAPTPTPSASGSGPSTPRTPAPGRRCLVRVSVRGIVELCVP